MALGAGASLEPNSLARHAQNLESAGVDLVWGGEIYGYDLVSTLAFVAGQTKKDGINDRNPARLFPKPCLNSANGDHHRHSCLKADLCSGLVHQARR